jgi:signal transduction histidine kinase
VTGLAKRDTFDLANLASQVIAARQAEAQDRQLRLHTALASAPVTGDPRLVERLIANLADNGLRHNAPGGSPSRPPAAQIRTPHRREHIACTQAAERARTPHRSQSLMPSGRGPGSA